MITSALEVQNDGENLEEHDVHVGSRREARMDHQGVRVQDKSRSESGEIDMVGAE